MYFNIFGSPISLYVAIYVLSYLLLGGDDVESCLTGQSQQQQFNRHSRAQEASTTITSRFYVHKLNSEDTLYAAKSNIRAKQGDLIYARLFVPWTSQDDLTLTLLASWSKRHFSTPLWLFIKKTGLPTKNDWDKTSISFVSRKFSRIRIENASPGQYFVMMEALTDLHNVTLTVSITPNSAIDDEKFGFVEDNQISQIYDAIP